eukprot:gb/GECG01001330.1/.p1 GENE.gb/GECG01001330.1/~~gb/GECG01001330.1/.p1  ORF type:complete len:698 (+),score=69.98 gb/GECG01001330.1/:1-2094(+)
MQSDVMAQASNNEGRIGLEEIVEEWNEFEVACERELNSHQPPYIPSDNSADLIRTRRFIDSFIRFRSKWKRYRPSYEAFDRSQGWHNWFPQVEEEIKLLFRCKRTVAALTSHCADILFRCRQYAERKQFSLSEMLVAILVEPPANGSSSGRNCLERDSRFRRELLEILTKFFPDYCTLILCSNLAVQVCDAVVRSLLLLLASFTVQNPGRDKRKSARFLDPALKIASCLPDSILVYESCLIYCISGHYFLTQLLHLVAVPQRHALKSVFHTFDSLDDFALSNWKDSVDLKAALNSELVCCTHTIFRCLQYYWCDTATEGSQEGSTLPFDTGLVLHSLLEEASFHRLRQRGLAALSRMSDALYVGDASEGKDTVFCGCVLNNDSVIDANFDMRQRRIMEYCLQDGAKSAMTLLGYLLDSFSGYEISIRSNTCDAIINSAAEDGCCNYAQGNLGSLFTQASASLGALASSLPIVSFSLKRLSRMMEMEDTRIAHSRAAYSQVPSCLRKLYSWKKWKMAIRDLSRRQKNYRLNDNNLKHLHTIPQFWRFAGTCGATDTVVTLEVLRFALTLHRMFSSDRGKIKPHLVNAIRSAISTMERAYEELISKREDMWSEYCVIEYSARLTLRSCTLLLPQLLAVAESCEGNSSGKSVGADTEEFYSRIQIVRRVVDGVSDEESGILQEAITGLPDYLDILHDKVL